MSVVQVIIVQNKNISVENQEDIPREFILAKLTNYCQLKTKRYNNSTFYAFSNCMDLSDLMCHA